MLYPPDDDVDIIPHPGQPWQSYPSPTEEAGSVYLWGYVRGIELFLSHGRPATVPSGAESPIAFSRPSDLVGLLRSRTQQIRYVVSAVADADWWFADDFDADLAEAEITLATAAFASKDKDTPHD